MNLSTRKHTIYFGIVLMIFLIVITVFSLTYGQVNDPTIIYIDDKLNGVIDNVVHINDLDADFYYYKGLNYTNSTNGTLPSGNNQNIYPDNKLVEVQLTYSGVDENNGYRGYVSLSELQDTYIYYKVFPVNDNNTSELNDDFIEITLIENPFTNKPTNKGFNGWITSFEGVSIKYDSAYYTRTAKVPITYVASKPAKVEITFTASWTPAKISLVNSSRTWATAFSTIDQTGMYDLDDYTLSDGYYSMEGYYYRVTVPRYSSIVGYYNDYGVLQTSGTCNTQAGCIYYSLIGVENFVRTNTYYELNTTMTLVNNNNLPIPQTVNYLNGFSAQSNMAGYFKRVTIPRYSSIVGYYSATGVIQTTGTCNTAGGCDYYELLQYYNQVAQPQTIDTATTYYYLATRDTNIIVMTTNLSSTWSTSETKPFTLTSVNNDIDYRPNVLWNTSRVVRAYNDTNIENIRISAAQTANTTVPPSGTTTTRTLYGNWKNVRLGRGITQSGTNVNFANIIGGNNNATGSSSNLTKYKLIIESGLYNNLAIANGASSAVNDYIQAMAIYGNDYDRATANNSNLTIYSCASGSWGGNVYSSATTNNLFELTVKSGRFGSSKDDYTSGIYVGGRQGGTHYAQRYVKVEGGWIYNLIGGPLSASSRENLNDTFIYMTGGSVDVIIGGAGTSATYGNRLIQVTGGIVNYSVFGGSNGYQGSGSDGTVLGSSFVYVGGKAIVGDPTLVASSSTIYGAEAGSVFGIGNGRSGYPSIGSSSNSSVYVHDEATINRNVYGGGNFGAVGISSGDTTTSTTIKMLGGTIKGDMYGGGNNNGSGATGVNSTINIEVTRGTIEGSVYGGSNTLGIIYGSVNLNLLGGTFEGNIYGGGKGGYINTTAYGTYIRDNINIIVGTSSTGPVILNNIYGGSAYGSVNTINRTISPSASSISVDVNGGTISGVVYGGGKGDDTFSPYVAGDVTVNIDGGTIGDVYGGNDANGLLFKDSHIYLNGGNVNNVYGGSNQVGANTTNVLLQGATTNTIYGGSNQTGNVTKANVTISSGSVNTVYGGNNLGGQTATSDIVVNSGSILDVYGGGRFADVNITNIDINGGTITNVYGGGQNADINISTAIVINGGSTTNIYGGSNQAGTNPLSSITVNSGNVDNLYGGNNQGGKTSATDIIIAGGTLTNVYGGGRLADGDTTNINLTNGIITSVYGGGQNADILIKTKITQAGANATNVYGGSNQAGAVAETSVIVTGGVTTALYGGNNQGGSAQVTSIEILGGSVTDVYGGGNQANSSITNVVVKDTGFQDIANLYGGGNAAGAETTNVIVNGGEIGNLYGGSNQSGNITSANVFVNYVDYTSNSIPVITEIYGGNNQGGTVGSTNIDVLSANVQNIYGGGNRAITNGNTDLLIDGSSVTGFVYGGGNEAGVSGNASSRIKDAIIGESVYSGGNGVSASVLGNTTLIIEGATTVANHVFGGGNAAQTGTEQTNNSVGILTISGGTIEGNVYGGANTSILYGTAKLNIGYDFADGLSESNISIKGTVFGGGEANASGSENYDFSFISVTNGIDISIRGNEINTLTIEGSIFGSGNASSTTGYSSVYIEKYGDIGSTKANVSIQRADLVVLDSSHIELSGTTDRTNEYSTTLFTLSRVEELKLKNNSSIYLETGANLLEKVSSVVEVGGVENKAAVDINESGVVSKNVDNRIYVKEGKNLNIATNESATAYGEVSGMMFFGMFSRDRDGNIDEAFYSATYDDGDTVLPGEFYRFASGSYVLGRHLLNHNIEVDGFYSNYENDLTPGVIDQKYITPSPEDSTYYMWVVGESVVSYDISLAASKFSTLGSYELPLINFSNPNTTFSIVGFNYNDLPSDFELVKQADVPRISTDGTADSKMSLVMKNSNTGWMTVGETNFITSEEEPIYGSDFYATENSSTVPTLLFYIYHSKNIETSGPIGVVTISLIVVTPIDDLTNQVDRININVELSRVLYTTNNYEGSMTTGEEHDIFVSTSTNINSKSKLSSYFSLYVEKDVNLYNANDYRSLVSTFVFPENTKITMIDLFYDTPVYYYYTVSAADVAAATAEHNLYGEASYPLARFIKMGSTSSGNNYSDAIANVDYYDPNLDIAHEEFIFNVDFKDTPISSNQLDNYLLLELRSASHQTLINVLGIQHEYMKYNVYFNSDATIAVDFVPSKTTIYSGEKFNLDVTTNFTQPIVESKVIHDTRYLNERLGLKITIHDYLGSIVNGIELRGLTIKYNGVTYYPQMDGSVRINIAEKVANVFSRLEFNTANLKLPSGNYTIKIESFGSPDGIFFGASSSDSEEKVINFINLSYGLKVDLNEQNWMIDKETGNNKSGNNALVFDVKYSSTFANPSIKVALYRRKYDTIYSLDYELVDLKNYVTNTLVPDGAAENKRYLLSNNPTARETIFLYTKNDLVSGTYKFVFSLYDGTKHIGSVNNYVIIK